MIALTYKLTMKTYKIEYVYSGRGEAYVEADSEDEAVDKFEVGNCIEDNNSNDQQDIENITLIK